MFKFGDSFLKDLSIVIVGDSTEEQILDSISPFQLLGHAVSFSRTRASPQTATILEYVFSACLQVDPANRLFLAAIAKSYNPSRDDM